MRLLQLVEVFPLALAAEFFCEENHLQDVKFESFGVMPASLVVMAAMVVEEQAERLVDLLDLLGKQFG